MDITIHCAHDDVLAIVDLKAKFHPRNPNIHSDHQIARLAKILNAQGARKPATISKRSGFITAGHGRIMAAERAGFTKFPVDYQEYETEELEYADLTADNAIASWAELDLSGINSFVPELGPDFDLDLLGIKDFVLEPAEKLEPGCDEDEVPSVRTDTISKPRDIWLLGRHRLMCGDSTNVQHVDQLMSGEKADMVFTDPPYGVSYVGKTAEALTIEGDELVGEGLRDFALGFLACLVTAVRPGSGIYISCPLEDGVFLESWHKTGLKLQSVLVWLKNTIVLGRKDYHYKHEPILYGWLEGEPHRWYGGRDKSTIIECAKPPRNGEHPTMKPVELIEALIGNSSKTADRVLDLFGGSGSTLIACEKTDRRCFMMELDPKYVDVIVARWEKYTGLKAERLNGETEEGR